MAVKRWVNLTKREPEAMESVIGWIRFKGDTKFSANEVFRDGGTFFSVRDGYTVKDISHWMPMPDGPRPLRKGAKA